MISSSVSRRTFLATSSGTVAALAIASIPSVALAASPPISGGAIYGRVGTRGISAGTADSPSRGDVILLDGSVLEVSDGSGPGIRAGSSVLLAPGADGGWSVLYAEYPA